VSLPAEPLRRDDAGSRSFYTGSGSVTWIHMPTRNVKLTDKLSGVVLAKDKSGRYENASEVLRAALRTAIDEGDSSGIAGGNPFTRIREKLKLPPRRR
jgi:hypothetical protein